MSNNKDNNRQVLQGNIALAEAAVRGGCRFFAGYPITPQTAITEYLSQRLPEIGGQYIQAESEIGAVFMVQGASAVGAMAMTATSGQGLSLMTEGMSMLNAQDFPAVIVDVERGGAGSCPIKPSQSDYHFLTKSIGHGGYKAYVLGPSTVQEAVDLVYDAFEFSQRYRCLVLILTDGMQGLMMESVVLPPFKNESFIRPDWAVRGNRSGQTIRLASPADIKEADSIRHDEMYKSWQENELKYESYMMDDAEYVVIAWGSAARTSISAIRNLRKKNVRVGLFRPITLFPFPLNQIEEIGLANPKKVFVFENAVPAQFYDDVDHALKGTGAQIRLYCRSMGNMITPEEVEAVLTEEIYGE